MDEIRENRLKCFGHVYLRSIEAIVRKNDAVILEGNSKERGIDQN